MAVPLFRLCKHRSDLLLFFLVVRSLCRFLLLHCSNETETGEQIVTHKAENYFI